MEATSQTLYLQSRILSHQNSSPTHLLESADRLGKIASKALCENALLRAQIATLEETNKLLIKRKRAIKKQLKSGGILSVADGQLLVESEGSTNRNQAEGSGSGSRAGSSQRREPRCSKCNNTGHNSRVCTVESGAIPLLFN